MSCCWAGSWTTERREFEFPEERTDEHQPIRKAYVYGDDREAAEDAAYVFFKVWKFPPDWTSGVTAEAFYESVSWKQFVPLGPERVLGSAGSV